jgi:hypothetical protein
VCTLLAAVGCGMLAGGCGAGATTRVPASTPARSASAASSSTHQFSPRRDLLSSRRIGQGPAFTPPPHGSAVAHAAVVDGLRCLRSAPALTAVHVEVFAKNHVVVIPAGIGIAPPLRHRGAYVLSGRCVYPLRTLEPTGLVELAAGPTRTLGQLFELWGQSLSSTRVASFAARPATSGSASQLRARVSVYSNGVRWHGSPDRVPLTPHVQITIELGPHVPPHVSYVFPHPLPGLAGS